MRRLSLSQQGHRTDEAGNAVSAYEWRGCEVWVRDSARTALLVFELFADEELEPEEKAFLLPRMMFADPQGAIEVGGDDAGQLLIDLVWDAYGLDISGDQSRVEESVFDWEQDADRIRASLLSAYSMTWEQAACLPYSELIGLLASLMETGVSTPFREAVSARVAKVPKITKYNKEERDAIKARKEHFALKSRKPDAVKAANDAASDTFAAAKARAKAASHG